MAPGSRVGNVGRPVSDIDLGPGLNELRERTVGLSDARSLGVFKQRISDEGIAAIRNMVDALDGYSENGVELDTTAETVTDSGVVQRETIAPVRFAKLSLIDQLFHTVASPPVAYLLLLIGLALLVFEFFTAGVGIAGGVGCRRARSWPPTGSLRSRRVAGPLACSSSRWLRSPSTSRSGSHGSGPVSAS